MAVFISLILQQTPHDENLILNVISVTFKAKILYNCYCPGTMKSNPQNNSDFLVRTLANDHLNQ